MATLAMGEKKEDQGAVKTMLAGLVVAIALTGCATLGDLFVCEKDVALSKVPAPVLTAAKGAVKGVVLSEAEMKKEDGQVV